MYQWTVVGAGPAGILTVGKLLDEGVKGENICWIDPMFNVGGFGQYCQKVSSNTVAELFIQCFKSYKSFMYNHTESVFKNLDNKNTCEISLVVQELKKITENLSQKVVRRKAKVNFLKSGKDCYLVAAGEEVICSAKVVLATGSEPKVLSCYDIPKIDLKDALDVEYLSRKNLTNKNIAVFGSSHSAVIVIKNLLDLDVNVHNFYRSPLKYAVKMNEWTLYDNTGLKGNSALWAKENLYHGSSPRLKRYHTDADNVKEILRLCDYAIYAVGFTKRNIKIDDLIIHHHNPHNGIIAPGVFGIGIAYPEEITDLFGYLENNIGMFKFKHHLNKIFPVWQKYP